MPPFVGMDIAYQPAEVLDPSRLVVTDKRSLRVAGCDDAFAIGDATNLPTSKAGSAPTSRPGPVLTGPGQGRTS